MTRPFDARAFHFSLAGDTPPPALPPHLRALWHDARGEWGRAHDLVEDGATRPACRVHAYLHRREGDEANAAYWYRRAGESPCREPLDRERDTLIRRYLADLEALPGI
ncbi:hypothetical protein AA13595_2815 [Gluconacetobacter johannae DSM 13595]|uniref:Uncharacterized protein n=1 Tax=Gluconacetobacter johannae TaxID=112140 RepID=A0A7W4J8D1_9PROT|nr:hypothetical protein [Gluconacetobacter johannae]MBB2176464.1 hypothetical protein [Gluconacetobacter johannae]GBQ90106.1 hypothetical protein AA13595_2815 [Gluconacetobacter johannae DSM 13595]